MKDGYLIYLRKSRADGEHENVEEVLARHEKILQEYAEKTFGEPIAEECIYREVVSGETIQDRPQINALLSRIQNGLVKGVLTVEPQRLSRGDLSDCGTIIRAFRYTDTLVITPTKTYDLSDKFDRKFFEMELMRGNDYLEYVKEIMLRGRLASVSEGNYIGSGSPFGYDKVKVGKSYTLIPNDEAAAVRYIFELWVNQCLGTTTIAHKLDEYGIKPRKSEHWSGASVRDMLRNPVYIGKIRWNWRKTVKKYEEGQLISSRPKSAPDTWIMVEGKHEPIIDEELFNAAQARFGNAPRVQYNSELVNPFAGILRCSCGRAMIYQPGKKCAARIHCANQINCANKSARYEDVEQSIIESLNMIIDDFKHRISDGNNKSSENDLRANQIEKLTKELNNIETQQDMIYDLLEQGIYSHSVFIKRNEALAEKRKNTEAAIEEVKSRLVQTIDYQKQIVSLSKAVETIKDTELSAKAKNDFLKTVLKEIRYERKTPNRSKWDKTPYEIEIFLDLD